ncbi:nucleotidyltransferase domain-containing protein [Actinoplanes sp. NPDC026623]|uniref:nucleotidyltransferase domain-containing protein n=1 Tax=Actinoplanes sp. NPDC026623 TaxID=3155610 RepID=UPI0033F61D87
MTSGSEASALTAAGLIAGSVFDIAGTAGRSVIVHGSLAAGGFRPGRSDIDLLVVVDGGLTDAQAAAIEGVVRRADAGTAAGIDLHVVTAEAAGAASRAPALELYLGRHRRSPTLEVERRVAASPDLATELSMALSGGRALAGAPPGETIAPVPAEWVIDRGRHWLTAWRSLTDDAAHAAFMALTTCRIWRFAVDRVHCSKPRAATWALDRDPSLTAVRQALRQYEHHPATVVSERGLADLLDTVLGETARDGPSR